MPRKASESLRFQDAPTLYILRYNHMPKEAANVILEGRKPADFRSILGTSRKAGNRLGIS